MSLILDALARAERDKRREAEPLAAMIGDEDRTSSPDHDRRRTGLLVTGIALVAVLIAVAVWSVRGPASAEGPRAVVLRDARTTEAAASRSPAQKGAPAVPMESAPRSEVPSLVAPDAKERETGTIGRARGRKEALTATSEMTALPPAPRQGLARAEVQSLYDAVAVDEEALGAPRAESSADAPAVAARRGVASTADAQGTDDGTMETEADNAASLREAPVDLERLLREVQRASESGNLAPHPTPLLAELSQQFRNDVPTLMYLRHDYSAAGNSTVLLNGATLPAGGRTRGVEVVEILPDSIVCRFQGQEFRLRALNSWVNL